MSDAELVPQPRQFTRSRGRGWGVQCKHIKRDGERCGRWAIIGGFVCPKHGGQLPGVKVAAKARIRAMLPAAIQAIEDSLGDDKKDEVRLRAANMVLRWSGIKPNDIKTVAKEQRALNAGQGAPLPNTDAEIEALLQTLQLEAGDESGPASTEGTST